MRHMLPALHEGHAPIFLHLAFQDALESFETWRNGEPEPNVRTLEGWRREVVGAELLELLAGNRTLRVGDGHRLEISGD